MNKISQPIQIPFNQFEEEIDELVHDCPFNKICISNQCSNTQKLCCIECVQFYHPSHTDKIHDYVQALKHLKQSIKYKNSNLVKKINYVKNLSKNLQKQRDHMLKKIQNSFQKIDTYCSNLVTIEANSLQQKFESVYEMSTFNLLKDLTQSAKEVQLDQQLQIIQNANKIFSKFESEYQPYLQFKSRKENEFNENVQLHIENMKTYLLDLNQKNSRFTNKIYKLSKEITQTHLINFRTCNINSNKIEKYETPISQMVVLNKNILLLSMRVDVERQFIQFIDYSDQQNQYEQINELTIQHEKIVDLKSRQTFLVVSDSKISKIRYSAQQIYTIKQIFFIEKILLVEFIPETNSILVITKDFSINNQNIKLQFYRASDFSLYKRYTMDDSSKTIITACSFQTNTLVTANQRHLKIYQLISGRFNKFYVVGDTINDNIIDLKFQKQQQLENKDELIVSNIQGLVTKISFPKINKKIVNTKSPNEKVFFCIFEELKLFTDKRYIQFIIKPGNTQVKVLKIKKNLKKNSKTEKIDQVFELDEEYTCHSSYNILGSPSSYNLFIGTSKGSFFHFNYSNIQS
ncbi:hypothetical protein TTHERM_00087000 (macronuclear) [Tetrahymena thermophila SB210]|uniref:Uncharacterized protein n=1 Tax=Tetrahymena thermophila (strain SB210) TaxID=312017 RepID=Q236J7_TETTS|nr:hypothetical protein TTHERM_00087000 [Tetrahymena thermophila SB210]EAR92503.2 hypothetical protein TTHERM_00087000 [Tetrahymena thermophila SB210]|eukprot:XP_001012748.2 hypothetical protein TTHERM_00087000 [Tetrahymena thermophila SB210]